MKIIQFMASAGYGGAEKVFVELSNALAENHDVTAIIVRDCQYRQRFSPRVTVKELKSNPTSQNPFLHYELFRILSSKQPEIIHTHAAKGSMLVHRVNRFLGFKHLGTKHNDRKGRIFNKLQWVSAVSHKGYDSVKLTVDGKKRVIFNGVKEEKVAERQASGDFSMLAVGRLDKIKGFDYLIRQVAQLDFQFTLQIVGEGPEKESLLALIDEYGLTGQVILTGFRDDIPQMMRNSDLVILSSHREGCPKVLLEAFFYAPLVLATRVGDIADLLPEELQTSLETMPADISRIYAEYDKVKGVFESIREQKQKIFSFDSVVSQYETYFIDILKSQ
jgi:glycosyltransferase involved in cell wall biosynthesis